MKREEVENVLPLFEGAVKTGKIKRSVLKNWLASLSFFLSYSFYEVNAPVATSFIWIR